MYRRLFSTASKRTLATASAPARESTFVRVWMKPREAWPIILITAGALTFSAYKIYHDLSSHDYHFNRHERSTIDYLENDRSTSYATSYGESAFHKGPKFIRERMIKKE